MTALGLGLLGFCGPSLNRVYVALRQRESYTWAAIRRFSMDFLQQPMRKP